MSRPPRWLFFLMISIALVACRSGTPIPTSPESPAGGTVTPTATVGPETLPTPSPGVVFPTGSITLTIWTTESFAPSDADNGGRLLQDQLQAFERGHPDVSVEVIPKRATGPGGIMDYLHLAPQVAPAVLPDLTVLSSQMLQQAAADGNLHPFDDLLAPEIVDDLFPVADALGRVDGQLVGVPFLLEFEHIVYNTAVLTGTAPTTWEAVLESDGPYIFPVAAEFSPADTDAPVDSTLIHYLAAGGSLFDEEGYPHLEIDPLTETFRFYQQGDADHVIPAAIMQTNSLEESWVAYSSGNALVAHVNSTLYLQHRNEVLNTKAAAVPGPEGVGPPLAAGWHWALITPELPRQQLAADLLSWLLSGENLGRWTFAGRWIPATEGALAAWPADDKYVRFAGEQLRSAIARPDDRFYQIVTPSLGQAVRDVLLGNSTPATAAAGVP